MYRVDDSSAKLQAALKKRLYPALRGRGFKGSYPHLHRIVNDRAHFVSTFLDERHHKFRLAIGRGKLREDGLVCEGLHSTRPMCATCARCETCTRWMFAHSVYSRTLATVATLGKSAFTTGSLTSRWMFSQESAKAGLFDQNPCR